MFQLIVAVISIALVAALAIASIFYGGEAFTRSSEKANVTALVNQAQQISGAYALYKTDVGAPPAAVTNLSPSYLAALPTPSKVADGAWAFNATGNAVEVKLATGNTETGTVCQEVARQAGGSVDSDGDITKAAAPQFDCVLDGSDVKFSFKL